VLSWQGRRTVVTGAGGFIGGHLTVALNSAGARVRAFCRYNSRGDRGALDWFGPGDTDGVEVLHGDLRDPESVRGALDGADTVFHLGAQIAIPYSLHNPRDFIETNIGGSLNVAEAALATGVRRVVHVSTSEVYGTACTFPITLEHPLAPRSPYAASKAGADMLMISLQRSRGLPVVIARPFNTYGPHQSARAVIPALVIQALQGETVKLGRLTPRRDFTYVTDTVAGLIAIGAVPAAEGETVQLGSESDIAISELVELVSELIGRPLIVESEAGRVRPDDSEIDRLLCDAQRMKSITGWKPQVALRTGLSETIGWLERNQSRYRADEYAT
jgi:nucleoside-diphosphate-sugar epimerase